MTNLILMKVKVGQLKARLSQYLREIQQSGETIEVCVREAPVAYLSPTPKSSTPNPCAPLELESLLAEDGIRIVQWAKKGNFVPTPQPLNDGKSVSNSVVAMREEKNW